MPPRPSPWPAAARLARSARRHAFSARWQPRLYASLLSGAAALILPLKYSADHAMSWSAGT